MSHQILNNNHPTRTTFGHAIVIGSSIAGLTAARVLTDYFERVTVIDRDRLPDTPDFRRGVPQARHAHTLPLRGQAILEQQFPGLAAELLAQGATAINGGSEMAFYIGGGWHQVRHQSALVSLSCSRPLLESTIYRRLARHPRLQIIQEQEAVGLDVDSRRRRVTGVRLRRRRALRPAETRLAADLVIDASGRESRAPQWLAGLGYPVPQETIINAFPGYATRIYRRPTDFNESWKTLYVKPAPPDGTRGGFIIPIEGDRWHVTLIGMARDYPPLDEAGFLAFARSLPAGRLYEAIKAAEPLTKPYGYRRGENRLRHYDRLPRYLEGFLVCGDAAYALNPVYAQGMTAAAMAGQALALSLEAHRRANMTGLARIFQQQLSRVVADPWRLAVREDKRWPATEVAENVVSTRPRPRRVGFKPAPAPTYNLAYH